MSARRTRVGWCNSPLGVTVLLKHIFGLRWERFQTAIVRNGSTDGDRFGIANRFDD